MAFNLLKKTILPDSSERTLLSPLELKRRRIRILYIVVLIVLVLFALSTLFPLFWLYSGALKTPREFFQRPPMLLPNEWNWENYTRVIERFHFLRYFVNTLAIAAGAWLMQMLVTTTAAYSLSKLNPAFGKVLLFLFFSTIMVPGAMLLIPTYLTVVKVPIIGISLLQTWWAIWLPGAVNGFGIFLMKNFFDAIPVELTDAARIEGANDWQVFTRIVLPLAKPAIAVLTIGTVIGSYQDFFWPYLVLTGNYERAPIMVGLFNFGIANASGGQFGMAIAASAIAALPPMILFMIFQKQIIRGINLSGLQG
jgi:multiple sugar transport system permease protein